LTATELAAELGVSVRTIYRDLDALSSAGVPVYAERGPGGGCSLLEPYRTTLTGLTADEARVLFMLSVPEPLVELGVSGELKAALRKLLASLPASSRADEARTRRRIHLDPSGWSDGAGPDPRLQALHRAVWQDRAVRLTHRLAFDAKSTWTLEPLGLVAKAGAWYVVGRREGVMRVVPVDRITDVVVTEEFFTRSDDFDLTLFWEAWCAQVEVNRPRYTVTVLATAEHVPWLMARLAGTAAQAVNAVIESHNGDKVVLQLDFESMDEALRRILGIGGAVEVLTPRAMRACVADYAAQIVARYVS
jgi:predicted DNA-binding transcriptional regulator YafY